MKFATLEYTTKTGRIWKPTPDKPNYLSDPIKEIDPTSFGSYTTVFNGEHIPIDALAKQTLLSKPGSLSELLKTKAFKGIKKITGSFPPNYDISYLEKFDVFLLVHQVSDAHEILNIAKRIKQQYPDKVILGVPTWPFGMLQPHIENNPEDKKIFQQIIATCDVFITVVKSTQWWYEKLAQNTKTPIVYVPQIYPVKYATQYFTPAENKEEAIFIAGITSRPEITKAAKVATKLKQKFPNYTIYVTEIPGIKNDWSDLESIDYEVAPFQQWREHLPWLAKVKLVLNTDYTATRGRVQVDCAAVGTISIGANSDGQVDLFPDLASTPETTEEQLLEKTERILTDEKSYREAAQYALEHLQKYSFDESADRIRLLVKQYSNA